ncbi:membrane protein insertase YidC [Mycoplasma sp. 'Moose RK']|uniref:membrane protein insertase YidC n=1 Tax=Mycoplasma sp. 'Moose RK' TaxID=2780095 RepID=UPI0018C22A48|nr:membrane protein insertase YidC [Mycoplasma sp. 'Moose RK']MBG0730522.1 membrane protein insertase YidC [Mycoplasma sp. 'Moose RK']
MKNKQNRPKAFEYFQSNNSNNNKKTFNFKWVLKFLKFFVYAVIFSLSLTGCIQSIVIKTSYNVGEALEFYNSKDDITPNYTIFKPSENADLPGITTASKSNNFLISADTKKVNQVQILENLRQQIAQENNGNRDFGEFNSLIIFQNNKNEYEYLTGDKKSDFIFFSSSQNSYSQKTNWTPIKIPSPRYYSLKSDKSYFEKLATAKSLPVNLFDFNNSQSKNAANISSRIKNFFYKIDDKLPPVNRSYAIFARDVFQALYNKILTLPQFSGGKLEKAIKDFETGNGEVSVETQKIIAGYAETVKNLIFPTNFSRIDIQNGTYNWNNIDEASAGKIAFQNSIASSPVVSWGESWGFGPFYSLFVYPLSKIILLITESQSLYEWSGWITILAIIVVVAITKILSFIFRFKTIFSQNKQMELQLKKAKIDAKYEAYKKNKVMQQRHRQEVADLYKKNNFSPFAPFSQVLVTMPIFIAVWRALQGIPSFKVTYFLGLELSATSYQKLFAGDLIYLPIIIIVVLVQALQQFIPKFLNKKKTQRIMNVSENETMKKQQKTQKIVSIIFIFFGVIFQSSLQIYWIIGGIWEISQTLGIFYLQKSKFYRERMQPWMKKKKWI